MTRLPFPERHYRDAFAAGYAESYAKGLREGLMLAVEPVPNRKFGPVSTPLRTEIGPIEGCEGLQALPGRISLAATVDDVRAAYAPPA